MLGETSLLSVADVVIDDLTDRMKSLPAGGANRMLSALGAPLALLLNILRKRGGCSLWPYAALNVSNNTFCDTLRTRCCSITGYASLKSASFLFPPRANSC